MFKFLFFFLNKIFSNHKNNFCSFKKLERVKKIGQ